VCRKCDKESELNGSVSVCLSVTLRCVCVYRKCDKESELNGSVSVCLSVTLRCVCVCRKCDKESELNGSASTSLMKALIGKTLPTANAAATASATGSKTR